jgi:hypothetical protein
MTNKPITNLEPAINYFGSVINIAKAFDPPLTTMAVRQWLVRGIPPTRAVELANIAKGEFKPSDILSSLTYIK